MTDSQKTQAVEEYLTMLHDRAVATFSGGNKIGSAYLAEICGMWGACLKNRNDPEIRCWCSYRCECRNSEVNIVSVGGLVQSGLEKSNPDFLW